MHDLQPTIEIYGADILCASCVNAPSSKDTYEWLDAAIRRKYPEYSFIIRYIDIENEQLDERDANYAARIEDEEFFYPLVLINDEVIGEGYIQLKPVFQKLEELGFTSA
ncbi:MAG: YuzD family protein [Caryophanon sp.]|nr:YuzD family protein [Caryophanon sp.]